MESAEYSAHGDAISLATLAPIPSFAPFSLLPDELILAIVRHLPQLQNYPSGRERSWSKEQRSMESFASVDKRIRRIALSVRWETVMLSMFGWSTPLVLERLSQYGHLVKTRVVRAFSGRHQVAFQQQLDRTVACLSACNNLKDLTLSIRQVGAVRGRTSLSIVFQTLAKRAEKLERLRLDPSWNTLDGLKQFEDVLSATKCLKALYIKKSGFETFQMDDLGYQLHARQVPQLPPLPLLTTLSVPTANFITTGTFKGTFACKKLEIAYVRAGDIAHVAKCVGHSIQRLEISSLSPPLDKNPPPIFATIRCLKAYDGVLVYLPALFDPATPLEALDIDEMDDKVFAGLQEFYERQPRKTLACVNIYQPQTLHMHPGIDPGPEIKEEIQERRRLMIASHEVLERCLAWAATRCITIEAKWYKPDWSVEMSDSEAWA